MHQFTRRRVLKFTLQKRCHSSDGKGAASEREKKFWQCESLLHLAGRMPRSINGQLSVIPMILVEIQGLTCCNLESFLYQLRLLFGGDKEGFTFVYSVDQMLAIN